jgi:hypothetical protein
MATSVTKPGKGSPLRRSIGARGSGYSGTIRYHRSLPTDEIGTRGIFPNRDKAVEDEQLSTAHCSSSALVSGAKNAALVLLGLIPLAIALDAAGRGPKPVRNTRGKPDYVRANGATLSRNIVNCRNSSSTGHKKAG